MNGIAGMDLRYEEYFKISSSFHTITHLLYDWETCDSVWLALSQS